jgi:hypothetical protein
MQRWPHLHRLGMPSPTQSARETPPIRTVFPVVNLPPNSLIVRKKLPQLKYHLPDSRTYDTLWNSADEIGSAYKPQDHQQTEGDLGERQVAGPVSWIIVRVVALRIRTEHRYPDGATPSQLAPWPRKNIDIDWH